MLMRILLLAALAALLLGTLLYSQLRPRPLVVSGFVEAEDVRVGSRVGGRVARVHVEEGDRVEAGQVLVELEPHDLIERRAEAVAHLAARQAEFDRLHAGFRKEEIAQVTARRDQLAAHLAKLRAGPRDTEIAAAAARFELANTQLALARRTFERVKSSFERNAASADEMDRVSDELEIAQATLEVRRQELAELKEGTRPEEIEQAEAQLREAEAALALMQAGYRREEVEAARAAVRSAEAVLAAIDRQIAELSIIAPVDGVVEAIELEPGDLVPGNAPALSIVDTRALWVRAYVPENRLNLQLHQRVPVVVDAWPDQRFMGRITFISRQAEFTPGNVQPPEERSKQVFRIKVTLEEGLDVLRPGMAADVLLDEVQPATQPDNQTAATMGSSDHTLLRAESAQPAGPVSGTWDFNPRTGLSSHRLHICAAVRRDQPSDITGCRRSV